MYKNVFIDNYEQPDVVEDQNYFLTKIEKLKLYMIEFNENGAKKAKNYPVNCAIKEEKRHLIIVITYDKCTFSANDGIQKA